MPFFGRIWPIFSIKIGETNKQSWLKLVVLSWTVYTYAIWPGSYDLSGYWPILGPFLPIFTHFWPYLAIFGHFWLFLDPPEPKGFWNICIRSLTSISTFWQWHQPKKTPLINNTFHFHSFFFGAVVSGWSFTFFGPLLGAKILQSMTIWSLAPNSILWLWD